MRIESMIHDLTELERHMKTIQANIYAQLGKVDINAPTDEDCYKKCKIEFKLFEQRLKDLKVRLKIERDKQVTRKD